MANNNPRSSQYRRKLRARMKAAELPCALCGRPIHYDEPSDAKHPLSFVVDEIRPVSLWRQFGYSSPADAAKDPANVQPAHWCCNARKSNHFEGERKIIFRVVASDGKW